MRSGEIILYHPNAPQVLFISTKTQRDLEKSCTSCAEEWWLHHYCVPLHSWQCCRSSWIPEKAKPMIKIVCDGCGEEMEKDRVELTITRRELSGGYGMPAGVSHLCADCGRIAFAALMPHGRRK